MPNSATRPNILILMSDEHDPGCSSTYGHSLVETPHMDRLARHGATFDAAYCNSPLCAPSRMSFMAGKYVSRIRGWDNATPLSLEEMTWAYLLRQQGYQVALSGKMHLIGPDQLHGFEQQLAVDLHAGNFHPIHRWRDGITTASEPWPSVAKAGAGTTKEIEADDQAEAATLAYLRDPARKEQPFALCVGLIAPHFPFIVPEPYFSHYYPDRSDLPDLPQGHLDDLPPATQRKRQMFGFDGYREEQVRRARAAYYGLISYVDDKLGRLMDALEETGLADNTVIIHTSDHGEMLGEHGLWRKMSFYEQSARVPLQIAWPGVIPGGQRLPQSVSLVDVAATILDLGGIAAEEQTAWALDGASLLPLMTGSAADWKDEAFAEYLAHGTDRPRAMLRAGNWKLCYSHGQPPELELYNLAEDPGEFHNLANQADQKEIQAELLQRLLAKWPQPDHLTQEIIASQEKRSLIRNVAKSKPLF